MTVEEEHTPEESKGRSPLLTFLIAATLSSAPCLAAGALLTINPEYMAQLAYGPPEGAYVPGASIPLGLPIIGAALLLVLIGFGVNLLLVRWVRKNKLPLMAMLTFGVLIFVSFSIQIAALVLAVFGPAAIQIFKEYFLASG